MGPQPDGTTISDISDREFRAIFSLPAARIGPNMTVILDCSFSRRAWPLEIDSFDVVDEEEDEEDYNQPGIRKTRALDCGLSDMLAKAAAGNRIDWGALGTSSTDWS